MSTPTPVTTQPMNGSVPSAHAYARIMKPMMLTSKPTKPIYPRIKFMAAPLRAGELLRPRPYLPNLNTDVADVALALARLIQTADRVA